MQTVFHLQICLGRKSSLSRKHSKTFSPAEFSQTQIINKLEIFKDFFACKTVLAADHRCPGNIQTLFTCRIVLAAIDQQHGNIQIFSTSKTLSRKSSTTWKQSTTFSPAEISVSNYQQHGNIQSFFRLQKCLSRKSSLSRKNSKIFSPAEFSQTQIIDNLETFKYFFACRFVLAADHRYPENIQRLFRLQKCLSRRSSIPRKHSKIFSPAEFSQTQIINNLEIFRDFFTCRIVLAANDQQHGKIQRHFQRQKYLSLKLSTTWRHSKFFSPAELSQPQIMIIPKKFKDFFACKTVLAADHRYPENMQTVFHLQICLGRKSSLSRKYSKTFSPADLSLPQIIDAPEIFKNFFTGRIVLAANHQQPGNNQEHFRLQNCLGRKSSISRKHSQTFSPPELSWPQIIDDHENIQQLFHLQNCLSSRSSTTWKY